MSRRSCPRLLLLTLVAPVLAGVGLASARGSGQGTAPADGRVAVVEAVVADRDGRLAEHLKPGSFAVTVDGKPRRVLWVRHVSRGPGAASEANARRRAGDAGVTYAAEPVRNVLVVIDQATIARGNERAAVAAAGALIDRLGLDDRVAVVRIPLSADRPISMTNERPAAREELRLVAGQALQAAEALAAAPPSPPPDGAPPANADPDKTVDPDKVNAEREQQLMELPVREEEPVRAGRRTLPALLDLLRALQPIPERKVIALFSAGLVSPSQSELEAAAAAAASAHAVVHAFGMQAARDALVPADVGALERFAVATGGLFTPIGRNAERTVERTANDLSARYVIGIEGLEADARGRPRLRIEVPGERLTVRAASWLSAATDLADLVPAEDAPAAAGGAPVTPAARSRDRSREAPAAREAELQLALARLVEYVDGYKRQYSALVLQEEYWQSTKEQRRTLRSDLLLVRSGEQARDWVSFRDVYEVDGMTVRDRDERLKSLFLDQSAEAQAQLQRIKDESARYNIGQARRNINIPLYPLLFLEPEHRPRFRFTLQGKEESGGVQAVRIGYEEEVRPTLVRYKPSAEATRIEDTEDLPVRGWFLVDPLTGAIVGSRMELVVRGGRAELTVRYRRDPTLGLWVPFEMREVYQSADVPGWQTEFNFRSAQIRWVTSLEARATYSNVRRFQVKTDETMAIKKEQK